MLRSECDKLYQGRCSCIKNFLKKERTPEEDHWCSSQTTEVTVIDFYNLPSNTTRFVLSDEEISLEAKPFIKQIKEDKKMMLSEKIKKYPNGSTDIFVIMRWQKEADFLPSWIWMIESGYNDKRDLYNKKNNIKFSKQVITSSANFTIEEGPYTTKTQYPPYHVVFDKI